MIFVLRLQSAGRADAGEAPTRTPVRAEAATAVDHPMARKTLLPLCKFLPFEV
jgi:hypothetical protein